MLFQSDCLCSVMTCDIIFVDVIQYIIKHLFYEIVHKPNTDFGYIPKIPSAQCLLVFSILIEGALHKYG